MLSKKLKKEEQKITTPGKKSQKLRRSLNVEKTRLHLKQCFGEVCWYCGISLKDKNVHIDHIKPIRMGGTNEIENLAMVCKFCNGGFKFLK